MNVVVTRLAAQDAEAIDAWWRENRPAAPGRFVEELIGACTKATQHPFTYTVYATIEGVEIRRVRLEQTRQHVYYRVQDDAVHVVRIWGAQRGAGPRL
jgi:plasmid stabilization system protein ParE